ncbi:transposase [Candidatus Poribacteria bacterium]|nr:transposase [Candidatus Poribacteria bacterium]MBT5531552.1 transposase [Candidatus Poribacteria bacterium]MBT5712331.1 transposase [Candidatus Poribacteria bacterium]MBT7805007.1 transposase [Candidatus Poribacteria bacterium]
MTEDHPGFGYRRICPELSKRLGAPVNHKRVRRVLRCYELGLPRCLPASPPSPVQRVIAGAGDSADLTKGRRLAPMEAFSTDFTELVYAEGERKAWSMALVGIASRWAGGWSAASWRNRETASDALGPSTTKHGRPRSLVGGRGVPSRPGFGLHESRLAAAGAAGRPRSTLLRAPWGTRRPVDRVVLGSLQDGKRFPVVGSGDAGRGGRDRG